ncbi:DinB family protein [Granulicoccus sp. GXG6511]|uniref:DinB family protein n=1 Tax=Granulicoccus sp. GXG6511 TaxID=3381351 RepID=UPI003D7CF475
MDSEKAMLHDYLRRQREALLWKVDGLDERELRLPRTPTGTNLLGLVKHTAAVEQGYLATCFGRGEVEPTPWMYGDEPNADMWATAAESAEWVIDFYRRVAAHSDAAITELPLETTATVPWWPEERRHPTLRRILVHVIQETARHAGQADILREGIDGAAGLSATYANLPPEDAAWWSGYVDRLTAVAESFRD